MRILLGSATFLLATLGATSAEAARPARCVIDVAGAPTWSGPCQFEAERGGSFTVSPARGWFQNGVGAISLYVTARGEGEVRGLTRAGINSRWGPAQRSARDRACWVGEDFSLCVY